jgi:hypothetical protein
MTSGAVKKSDCASNDSVHSKPRLHNISPVYERMRAQQNFDHWLKEV